MEETQERKAEQGDNNTVHTNLGSSHHPTLGRVGVIGRWKPLHNGGALMLEAICSRANEVIIGIGSSNKYNCRNPFTPEESEAMLNSFLFGRHSNFRIIKIPDFAHIPEYSDGQRWRKYVLGEYGRLDCFVTDNEYVAGLLSKDYRVIHPAELIPSEEQFMLKGAEVRLQMAMRGDWKSLVPIQVSEYLEASNLVGRFRGEFGLETLAGLASQDCTLPEDYGQEKNHTIEK